MMGIVVKVLKAVLKFLRGPVFIVTAIALAVGLLIWMQGSKLRLGDFAPFANQTNRLYAELTVLGIWAFSIILILALKIRALNRDPEKDLAAAPKEPEPTEDPRMKTLKERFEHMISVLRRSNAGVSSVRTLPWYLMLGEAGSGKTNLLAQSDLELPLAGRFGQEDRANVHSTKLLDFWVSQDAVFLDIDGHLVDQHPGQSNGLSGWPDKPIWERLLQLVSTVRRRRPLNGVVVVIDLPRLIRQSDDERLQASSLIRSRLKELIETTGSQVPIYVALTKLDLIEGCHSFFKTLSNQEKTQLMGFSFKLFRGRADSSWLQEFDRQYHQMVTNMQELTLGRMAEVRDDAFRRDVYGFVRQLSGLNAPLRAFLNECFVADRFSTAPLIRGVYFTSSRQEAVPVNGLEQGVSATYGLTLMPRQAQLAKAKGYFGKGLFSGAIIPEAGVASDNIRVENSRKRSLLLISLVMSIVTVVLGFFWFRAFQVNQRAAGTLLAQVEAFIGSEQSQESDPLGETYVESLNVLRQARDSYGNFQDPRVQVAGLGLYRGGKVAPNVDTAYNAVLYSPFLRELSKGVANDLSAQLRQVPDDLGAALHLVPEGEDPAQEEELSKQVLEKLRIYRFLSQPDTRHERASIIMDYFERQWSKAYEGQSALQADLMTHLEHALGAGVDKKGELVADSVLSNNLDVDETVVQESQARILSIPRAQRVYADILENSRASLPSPLYLRDEMGPSFDSLYLNDRSDVNISLPRIFSAENYLRYFKVQNQNTALATSEDAWVLGLTENTSFSEADLRQFQDDVRDRYVGDFISLWRQGFAALKPRPFESLQDAEETLELLVSSADPMGRLLRSIERNTKFDLPVPEGGEQDTPDAALAALTQTADQQVASRINRSFQRLHSFDDPIDEGASYFEEAMVQIDALYQYVKAINESASATDAAFEQAKLRAQLSGPDPILDLTRLANGLPSPLREHFQFWADDVWRVVLLAAEERVEEVYLSDVVAFYENQLATCYPFNYASTSDCEITDFEIFFARGGVFETFAEDYLSEFVKLRGGTSADPLIKIGGRSMNISTTFLNQLEGVQTIRRAFLGNGESLGMTFKVTPLSISKRASAAVINIDGQELAYSHGFRRPTTFVWPNTLEPTATTRFSLTALNNVQEISIEETGWWNWYRMLRRGQASNLTREMVDLSYSIQGEPIVIRVQSEQAVNGITSELLASYRLSRSILKVPDPVQFEIDLAETEEGSTL